MLITSVLICHPLDVRPVDLKLCSEVNYEKKGCVHGVSYRNDCGKAGWTPVREDGPRTSCKHFYADFHLRPMQMTRTPILTMT